MNTFVKILITLRVPEVNEFITTAHYNNFHSTFLPTCMKDSQLGNIYTPLHYFKYLLKYAFCKKSDY